MALYEMIFLIRQDATAQQVEALVEEYKGIIEADGGSVPKVENWGVKSLAYRIRKNRKAYYTLLNLDCNHTPIEEVERRMRLNEDVIRFMTVKVSALEDGPSVQMQRRDRDDRRRRERDDRSDDRPRAQNDSEQPAANTEVE